MQTDEVLNLLQEVAAEVIEPRFRALADDEVMEKKPGDLVTVADREAEIEITKRLSAAYPDALMIGEEAVSADPSKLNGLATVDHWFTIDPVDGTRNFVHGSQDYAVMVSEVRGGQVVRGWIWQPERRLAYVAERGSGAWCGARRLRVAEHVGDLRGHTSRRALVGTSLGDLPPLELTWVCCGVDYPQIAESACDYLLYHGALPWDHAPGSLLIAEAGGVTVYDDGAPYEPAITRSPLIAAGSAEVAKTVLAALAEST